MFDISYILLFDFYPFLLLQLMFLYILFLFGVVSFHSYLHSASDPDIPIYFLIQVYYHYYYFYCYYYYYFLLLLLLLNLREVRHSKKHEEKKNSVFDNAKHISTECLSSSSYILKNILKKYKICKSTKNNKSLYKRVLSSYHQN